MKLQFQKASPLPPSHRQIVQIIHYSSSFLLPGLQLTYDPFPAAKSQEEHYHHNDKEILGVMWLY